MSNSNLTKQLMAVSLKKQMEKMPVNKISIQNIVDGCGLTRQAFYYHFHDVYELLGWIYSHEAVEYIDKNTAYKNWKNGYLEVFRYIDKNKSFCVNTLHSIGRDYLERFLFANTAAFLTRIIDEISKDIQVYVVEEKKKFIVDFYTPAFIALVVKWIEEGMKEEPENIVKNVGILIDGTVIKALKKFQEKG